MPVHCRGSRFESHSSRVGLTVCGLAAEGKRRVQGQAVHSHPPSLHTVPGVPHWSRPIELVMEACPGAVIHPDQDIIQGPLGRMLAYGKQEREGSGFYVVSLPPSTHVRGPERSGSLTLLRLPPAEHRVGSFGRRRKLDRYNLRLQEGVVVQLPEKVPPYAVVGGELDNHACGQRTPAVSKFQALNNMFTMTGLLTPE